LVSETLLVQTFVHGESQYSVPKVTIKKLKNKKYHIVGTVPKYIRTTLVERGNIDTAYTKIHDLPLFLAWYRHFK